MFTKGHTKNLGRKCSEEKKLKLRFIFKGEKSHFWRGGTTMNKEERKIYDKERRKRERITVINSFGGKCVHCGFSDMRALQIDHINGGGCKEKRGWKSSDKLYYTYLLESFLNGENKYQLLCANCNWIKRYENNENKS